nr:MAG TPA: hypothetical protein [Caudoviricetes sp.]
MVLQSKNLMTKNKPNSCTVWFCKIIDVLFLPMIDRRLSVHNLGYVSSSFFS